MLYASVVPDAGLGQIPLGRPHVWHKQPWVFQGRLPPLRNSFIAPLESM